jgi:hypothetical protein
VAKVIEFDDIAAAQGTNRLLISIMINKGWWNRMIVIKKRRGG